MANFDWEIYRELNNDLIKANLNTKNQIMDHWNKHGKYETRMIGVTDLTPDFDWHDYKRLNPDLNEANIKTRIDYELHWIRHGKKENRSYKFSNDYDKLYAKAFAHIKYATPPETLFRFQYVAKYISENKNIKTIIDVGSGRGVVVDMLKKINNNFEIMMVDLEKYNSIDVDFMKINLSLPPDRQKLIDKYSNKKYDILTCLDVLEHLDKSFISDVFYTFSKICNEAILTIANHSDMLDGIELHTIQENFHYWEPLILKYFKIVHYEEHYIVQTVPRLYLVRVIPIN
jgi:2-polyprenyl-3-methyl-5-hydroxy-6-metoxy-1,4-benzoquinol methylase